MRYGAAVAVLALSLALPRDGGAQEMREQCGKQGSPAAVQAFCVNVADATTILQPRIGIALTGGNPVPGTASTLGMRLGALPRVSLGVRVTAARVDLPPIERANRTEDVRFAVGSLNADLSVGIFQGFNLLPTVGGFGSLDALASIGTIPLPRGEGFDDSSPGTWAVGARVGLLRESFTAPGVSVSAMYRSFGNVTYGTQQLTDPEAYFRLSDFTMTSVRGTVGKRVLGFGITAGAGYDRYEAAVLARVRDPVVLTPDRILEISQSGLTTSRTSLFGNASFTFLILHIVGELGWQAGGSPIEDASDKLEKRGIFGGLALRLAI